MPRLKTNVREKPHVPIQGTSNLPGQLDIPLPESQLPKVEIPKETPEPQPEPEPALAGVEPKPEPQPKPEPKAAPQDDPTLAFKAQVEASRRAEEYLRQQHAAALQAQQQQQRPLSHREAVLADWKRNGISDSESAFFEANPEMLDDPALTQRAIAEAIQAGHERGSDTIHDAALFNFYRLQEEREMAQRPDTPAPDKVLAQSPAGETPEFFRPPPPPPEPRVPVSAPVSRNVPNVERNRDLSPSQVRLSAEEQSIARTAGISPEEYARNKIRMLREKASGNIQS